MKKLLHERLREAADCEHDDLYASNVICADYGMRTCASVSAEATLFRELADEIEKYYIPRPRFEDGEPVQIGDVFIQKCVNEEVELDKIGIVLFTKDGLNMVWFPGEVVPRPEPKVLDADCVEIKVGDTVWGKYSGVEHEVLGFDTCDGLLCVSIRNVKTGSTGGESPNLITHREPDSIKKAVGDLGELLNFPMCDDIKLDKVEEVYNRLTALVERDA